MQFWIGSAFGSVFTFLLILFALVIASANIAHYKGTDYEFEVDSRHRQCTIQLTSAVPESIHHTLDECLARADAYRVLNAK